MTPLRHLPGARIVALCAILLSFAAVRLPTLDAEERAALAERFAFTPLVLSEWHDGPRQRRRPVNPAFEDFSAWISAVGAAVAIADVDRDGAANDLCHIDPRTDRVTLAPAPETGARYALFTLDAAPLRYDAATMAPMGCVPNDLNEDGRIDLLVYYWGRAPIAFLQRPDVPGLLGPKHFTPQEIHPAAERASERWYTNAATFADLDGDGHQDLLIGNYFQDGARVIDAAATTPDSMQHSMSRAYNGGRNRVLLWRRSADPFDVAFEEVVDVFGDRAEHAWTLAIGAADLDGDLLPELYFANDFGPDRLFHNRSRPGALHFARVEGERRLQDPRSKVVGQDSFKGMGVDFADVNGDGELDFFVSNIAAEYALEENHFLFVHNGEGNAWQRGVAPYHDESEARGVPRSSWGWDTRFGDFDNDGIPEALQATGFVRGQVNRWAELQELATANDELLARARTWPNFREGDDLSGHARNPFYVQDASGTYHDLSPELGLDAPHVTRGIATADVDRDGDLDFVVANQWERSFLYRNETAAPEPGAAAHLGLELLLPVDGDVAAGRAAIGASVRVRRADGRVLVGQVDGGNGHSGVRSPELHFGLGSGQPKARAQVEIRYRDRHGTPARLRVDLEPGWHRLWLPDAPRLAAHAPDPHTPGALR